MAPSDDAGRPLVDPSVLDRLRAELDEDEGYCSVFVGNFIDYLPVRIGKLRLALTTGDLAGRRGRCPEPQDIQPDGGRRTAGGPGHGP